MKTHILLHQYNTLLLVHSQHNRLILSISHIEIIILLSQKKSSSNNKINLTHVEKYDFM